MRGDWIKAAKLIRATMDKAGAMLSDEQALNVIELYPFWNDSAMYTVNDRVRYNNILYKCLTTHTAQATWTPIDTPSLWAKVLIPDSNVIPEWEQPESTNPYMKGDKVIHNGITYESIIDNNTWEPGVVGTEALWKQIN